LQMRPTTTLLGFIKLPEYSERKARASFLRISLNNMNSSQIGRSTSTRILIYYEKGPLGFYSDHDPDNNLPETPKCSGKPRKRKNETPEQLQVRIKDWEANRPPEVEQEIKGSNMTQKYYTKHLLPTYIDAVHRARMRDSTSEWLLQEDHDPSHGTKSL
jgi:hypothetical protein